MKTKTLATGVKIVYDKKGNIKIVDSPYYKEKKNNPVRGSLLRYAAYQLKQLLKTF
jgi:hypothetical protein